MTNIPLTGIFKVTATFGQKGKYWANGHKGVDMICENKNIYATCNGTVRVVAFDESGWGQYVSIGDEAGNRHIFCHMVKGSVKVKVGQKVTRATVLGIMGTTGNSSGVHLHYQINNSNNVPVNPCPYMGIPNTKGTYNSKDYEIKDVNEDMTFKDENKIAKWAKEAVDYVSDAGIMVGDEKGNFNPTKNLTRQEFAVALERLMKWTGGKK